MSSFLKILLICATASLRDIDHSHFDWSHADCFGWFFLWKGPAIGGLKILWVIKSDALISVDAISNLDGFLLKLLLISGFEEHLICMRLILYGIEWFNFDYFLPFEFTLIVAESIVSEIKSVVGIDLAFALSTHTWTASTSALTMLIIGAFLLANVFWS